LSRTLGEDVRLTLTLCPAPLFARLDPVHLEQILLNLAVNAREAMPGGGLLTISTRSAEGRAVITIADSGTGMTAETLQRLFEPFFTTKDRGRGTGLGLATVYGIVKQNQGELGVESVLGQGSTFTLSFAVADPKGEPAPQRLTPVPSRQGLTILVVEDDRAVRETLERSLRADGHVVYGVASLSPAVQVAQLHAGLDLLITDVVMPEAGGKEVALAVQAVRPSLPVLFVSGYAPDVEGISALGDLLSKPFTQASLRAAVAMSMRRRRA
jgi:CheY-like chemotaxis protein